MSFEKFIFSQRQISNYKKTAIRSFKIAADSDVPEVIFHFVYEALIKLAISICADKGLRVKSRAGHHIELIGKLAEYLADNKIETVGNKLREKRNRDLYSGGIFITLKEAKDYLEWLKTIFEKMEEYFNEKQQKLKV